MAISKLFRAKTFFYYQLRQLHRSTNGSSVPSFNMDTEKKAFLDVLPEVINSAVTSPKFTDIPEVRNWVRKVLEYTMTGGKLGRGLMVSIGYRMFEEPGNYSEETQHSARVLGWCVEMAANKIAVAVHLDLWSSYVKEKNNIDIFNTDRIYRAIADHKCPYYSFKLPIFLRLLLVKEGKNKATKELHNICMDLGRLLHCLDDYMDAYGDEIVTGKIGRDIQEGKCTWVAVTALQHCNDAQRAVFREYYGSKDPEHVKRIKQLYDELNLPQLYEECERTMYEDLMRRILDIPHEGARIFLLNILYASFKQVS